VSYEIIDVAGDVGLSVKGKSLEECFFNAAQGLYSLITDPASVDTGEKKTLEIEGDNVEELLIRFLNELIFLFDAYGFIGKTVSVQLNNGKLEAQIDGEFFDPEKHERRLLVKAATYHNLEILQEEGRYVVKIVFDI